MIIILGCRWAICSAPFRSALLFTRLAARAIFATSVRAISARPMCCARAAKFWLWRHCMADAVKGGLAVALIWRLGQRHGGLYGGLAAFIGHLFPVWLDFKGGKGVAVFIGAILIMSPLTGLMFLAAWLVVAPWPFRMSSLAAITALILSACPSWFSRGESMAALHRD